MRNPVKRFVDFIKRLDELRRLELRLEFVLSDACNLNCRGCTHYSPLAPREFIGLDTLDAGMARLAAVCGRRLKKAYLMGGETLMYPHLCGAMRMLRRHFPTQKLYLFTNGLLLPRMDAAFFEEVRRQRITIAMTRYPIKFDYDAVVELCRSKGVALEIFDDRRRPDSFFRFALDPAKRQNPALSHFKCCNRGCLTVIGGRLYPCSVSGCVSHLNEAFGCSFIHAPGDFLEIGEIRSVKEILRLRDRAVPFCGYCIVPPPVVDYAPSRRERSEWIEE